MSLEQQFDTTFAAAMALREKQIQQSYRPVIGVHKWFARRPGTLFRTLLLAEYNGAERVEPAFFRAHALRGVIADPFMGGGTPLIEANRLGFHVVGVDINPMAWWVVRQELGPLDVRAFVAEAVRVAADVEAEIGSLYGTICAECGEPAMVKSFLWVKTQACTQCGVDNDLFPGYLLAEAERHPRHVLACSDCGALVELDYQPRVTSPAPCPHCGGRVHLDGPARKNRVSCRGCQTPFRYPAGDSGPPRHRMWAIEYQCSRCKPRHAGRFFTVPSAEDLAQFGEAAARLASTPDLLIPDDAIPAGDETNRLHRWGYRQYREMFNERQLLGLGILLDRILHVEETPVRHALLTVFSDSLRYQNMLCRYDTWALKCQDIFSVHGFPVGLIQCENNLLGIPDVGGGGFRHFVEKYRRAKAYCALPFETRQVGRRKRAVPIRGERIEADFVRTMPAGDRQQAWLVRGSATDLDLPPQSLDGVFTDPPYFANVQYAELMDFCYVWLKQGLERECAEFAPSTTRAAAELTGNTTLGRDLEHFTEGLSRVFARFAGALKDGAPFVFTYHHNQIEAYAPIVVALLDAGLLCTAVLPAPAEMSASLHINNTDSSILDSVFVARTTWERIPPLPPQEELEALLGENLTEVAYGGVRPTLGDARCLTSGHIARLCVQALRVEWDAGVPLKERMASVQQTLVNLGRRYDADQLPARAQTAALAGTNGTVRAPGDVAQLEFPWVPLADAAAV